MSLFAREYHHYTEEKHIRQIAELTGGISWWLFVGGYLLSCKIIELSKFSSQMLLQGEV
ncbi:MAG: hypothetical protein HC919_01445 [Oscillatoriales cyanobacterium SM2_2_1]|nr:hypothetical protein [Oscillatoriales cyanobacterium SM2_2_1]